MGVDESQPEHNLIQRAWRNVPDFFARRDIALPQRQLDQFIAATFSTGASYYYVLDFLHVDQPMYVSDSVERILGLSPADTNIQNIIDRVHPDDLAFVSRAEEAAITILSRDIGMEQVKNYKISYCTRLKTNDGSYRLFNHQALILATDETHGVAKSLGIHTDISHLTTTNNFKLSLLNLFGGESYLNIDVFDENNNPMAAPSPFTDRENDILRLLAQGKTSIVIAETLKISPNTVKNHRKNILKKAECKTTGQLISKCISEGLI
ncbi:LuxR C-terminal-related transcriptional regulator [Microbulbifer mangrovi]|uniref:LuxR C-terminal-related transcriptional regulator n=1 Tax=Microbulbifer mangrovi TaxID=927787 RepID=UPI000990365D|nr:LuxR C-terminal-related transcriptional regulator [Microbulbifer mangrovi]